MAEAETTQFVKNLTQWGMTDDQKKIARSKELGELFGAAIGEGIVFFASGTIIWAVLTFIIALNFPWIKVLGAYFIFSFLKNTIIGSLKK